MLDIKWIVENPKIFDENMKNRGADFKSSDLIKLDEKRREITTQIQELQNQRNNLAKKISYFKGNHQGGFPDGSGYGFGQGSGAGFGDGSGMGNNYYIEELMSNSKEINEKLKNLEENFNQDQELGNILLTIPNILDEEVPIGKSENDNQEVEKWGELPKFDFQPKEHFEIGEKLGELDFEQSAKISGARFSTLSGGLAKLERALSNFMLDVATEFGYEEISPPNLVKDQAMIGSGQLPKFASEAFQTTNGYWLIPTAEVSLVNLAMEKTFDEGQLPIRLTAYTPCFRSEAGSAGKDTRGMIRQHQFKKVELVSITDQESSKIEHERMTNIACEILKRLNLPYRKVLLCSADIGFNSNKTYDLEVWLPGQNKYREISSCSNCGDFQARRMKAKYKNKTSKKPLFVHTLNGSSLAVGRTIIAILENYQNKDGSFNIPQVLEKYTKLN